MNPTFGRIIFTVLQFCFRKILNVGLEFWRLLLAHVDEGDRVFGDDSQKKHASLDGWLKEEGFENESWRTRIIQAAVLYQRLRDFVTLNKIFGPPIVLAPVSKS